MQQNGLSWIQDTHRQEDSIQSYRRAFEAHPANLLVVRNFLKEDGAAQLGTFLQTEAQYETLHGLYSTMKNHPQGLANATETEWVTAEESDRFYRLRKFVGLSRNSQLTPNLVAYMKFRNAFNEPAFRQFFISVTGLSLDLNEATFHSFMMKPGDFLRHHDDTGNNNYHVAFVLYLTPGWQPEFGGELQMFDPRGEMTSVSPEYNSLVLFKVNPRTKHQVAPIKGNGDLGRVTISGWMHKPDHEQQASPSI